MGDGGSCSESATGSQLCGRLVGSIVDWLTNCLVGWWVGGLVGLLTCRPGLVTHVLPAPAPHHTVRASRRPHCGRLAGGDHDGGAGGGSLQ